MVVDSYVLNFGDFCKESGVGGEESGVVGEESGGVGEESGDRIQESEWFAGLRPPFST